MSDANVWNYVIGAYAVTWVTLLGYAARVFVLNRRARQLAVDHLLTVDPARRILRRIASA